MSDFNEKVIAEFRDNSGTVEQFGSALVLLHTVGARSGQPRINPVASQEHGEDWYVFASAAGADKHPDWFHNLVADPAVTIEVGGHGRVDTVPVQARVLEGDERSTVWEKQKQLMPGFADYEAKTEREIPVVELTRR